MESDNTCEARPQNVPEAQDDAKKSEPFFSTKFLLTLLSGLIFPYLIAILPLLIFLAFAYDQPELPQPGRAIRAVLTFLILAFYHTPWFTTSVTAYCLACRKLSKRARRFAIILLVLASFEFLFLIYMTSFPLLRSLLRWIASLLLSIG